MSATAGSSLMRRDRHIVDPVPGALEAKLEKDLRRGVRDDVVERPPTRASSLHSLG